MDIVLGLCKELVHPFFCVGGRFFSGQYGFFTELDGTLERRYRVVSPVALQIGVTVTRARYGPRGRAFRARLWALPCLPRHQRNRQRECHKRYQRTQGSMVHCRLLG